MVTAYRSPWSGNAPARFIPRVSPHVCRRSAAAARIHSPLARRGSGANYYCSATAAAALTVRHKNAARPQNRKLLCVLPSSDITIIIITVIIIIIDENARPGSFVSPPGRTCRPSRHGNSGYYRRRPRITRTGRTGRRRRRRRRMYVEDKTNNFRRPETFLIQL